MEELPDLEWVITLARTAGAKIKKAFFKEKHTSFKLSSSDLLTETDVAIEEFIRNEIQAKYGNHELLCEESSSRDSFLTDAPTWVIDPVDGTTNFVHTLPFLSVSIGFAVNKSPVLGVIYNPIMDELFYAIRGSGAYLVCPGSKQPLKLHVAEPRETNHSLVATGFCSSLIHRGLEEEIRQHLSDAEIARCAELKEITMKNTRSLIEGVRDIRRLGSCTIELAFLAAGRLDGVCELCVKEWDLCAGILIVQEAGGHITDYQGELLTDIGKRQVIAASSERLCQKISAMCISPTFNLRELEK